MITSLSSDDQAFFQKVATVTSWDEFVVQLLYFYFVYWLKCEVV